MPTSVFRRPPWISTEVFNAQYEGISDTLVQWLRFRKTVVIATTNLPGYASEERMREEKMKRQLVRQPMIDQLFEPIGSDAGASKAQLTERERGA